MPANAVVLDANLLVLFMVGTASVSYIARHKRLRAYTARDYDLLVKLLASAPTVCVTPNTVTEASNLARQIDDPARTEISDVLRRFLGEAHEIYVASLRAADAAIFVRLGITDAGLLDSDFADHVLVTADLDLYLEATRQGREAMNFNHHIEASR
jgi:hypothetical protein